MAATFTLSILRVHTHNSYTYTRMYLYSLFPLRTLTLSHTHTCIYVSICTLSILRVLSHTSYTVHMKFSVPFPLSASHTRTHMYITACDGGVCTSSGSDRARPRLARYQSCVRSHIHHTNIHVCTCILSPPSALSLSHTHTHVYNSLRWRSVY